MRGRKKDLIACVNCRQMKVACDRNKQFPAACSRCAKKGALCSIDPAFKRESKRKRLEAVEKELQRVKQNLTTLANPQPDGDSRSTLFPSNDLPSLEEHPSPFSLSSTDRTIGGIHVPATLVDILVYEFYSKYHSFCPILPSRSRFLVYSDASPFLFWTVLVTALRRLPEHRDLYSALVDVVRPMAIESSWHKHGSLLSLQAILLLCCWPLPFKRNEDPSHSLVAISTHLGLRLGLHRPRHSKDFGSSSSLDNETIVIRRITWVACFITNVSLSAQFGLPPTARLDHGLLELLASKPPWLPETLYIQLHLARRALSITLTLGCCETSPTGLLEEPIPFIKNFDTDLQALECQFSASWSPAEHILFLGCRIMLYTFALTSTGHSNIFIQSETPSHWLVRAYSTTTSTIQASFAMKSDLVYAPIRMHKVVMNSVCFLSLLRSSKHCSLVDSNVLSNAIAQGWDMLQGMPVTEGDFMSRACTLLEKFKVYSETASHDDKIEDLLAVQLRMGANISFSTAMRASTLFSDGQRDNMADTTQGQEFDIQDIEGGNFLGDLDFNELFGAWLSY